MNGEIMKSLHVAIMTVLLLAWCAPEALAAGFGFYGKFGEGKVRYNNAAGTLRENTEFIGAGMVLDTAVARDRLFNYRLHVGYEKLKNDLERLESVVVDQDFGLALHRSKKSRIWLGPELRIAFSDDDIGIGIGPVVGVNLHAGRSTSVVLKGGVIFTDFSHRWYSTEDFERNRESHAFLTLAILFRSHRDRF